MSAPIEFFKQLELKRRYTLAALITRGDTGHIEIDRDLLHACTAWPSSGAEWLQPTAPIPDSSNMFDHWYWLWQGCTVDEYDRDTLSDYQMALGRCYQETLGIFRKLKQAMLIYPDGTIHSTVLELAETVITEALQPKQLRV